jgi:NtrC-family two-component system sensor histidine kinase KinB
MSIKTKVTLGVLFLFVMILSIGGLSLYYMQELSQDSKNILTDNYETLQYTKEIIAQLDRLKTDSANAIQHIEKNVALQENNITEAGEGELTSNLRSAFEKLKNSHNDAAVVDLRNICLAIQQINMEAIQKKNINAERTFGNASTYLILVATFCVLAAFTFILNFPGYIANPISQLTSGIKRLQTKIMRRDCNLTGMMNLRN